MSLEWINRGEWIHCRCVPAGAFGEDDEMRMIDGALDEFHASEVLPVTHGLFEEGLVGAREVGVDFVRNDAVVPNAILTGRCRSPPSFTRRRRRRRRCCCCWTSSFSSYCIRPPGSGSIPPMSSGFFRFERVQIGQLRLQFCGSAVSFPDVGKNWQVFLFKYSKNP